MLCFKGDRVKGGEISLFKCCTYKKLDTRIVCVHFCMYVCVCVREKLSFVLNENNLSIFYACVKE